jgi:hypothetical protein
MSKLTRLQFELAGYCYACALRGELQACGLPTRKPAAVKPLGEVSRAP